MFKFMIVFASCFMIGKAYGGGGGWNSFPNLAIALSYSCHYFWPGLIALRKNTLPIEQLIVCRALVPGDFFSGNFFLGAIL
jgi:hypothetical protein